MAILHLVLPRTVPYLLSALLICISTTTDGQLHVNSNIQPHTRIQFTIDHKLSDGYYVPYRPPYVESIQYNLTLKYSEFFFQSNPQCIMIFSSAIFLANNNTCTLPTYCGSPVVTLLQSGWFVNDYMCYGLGFTHKPDIYVSDTTQVVVSNYIAYYLSMYNRCPPDMDDSCALISNKLIIKDVANSRYSFFPGDYEHYAYRCEPHQKCYVPAVVSTQTGYCIPTPKNTNQGLILTEWYPSLEELLISFPLPLGPLTPEMHSSLNIKEFQFHNFILSPLQSYSWSEDGKVKFHLYHTPSTIECDPVKQTQFSFYSFGTFIYRTASHILLILFRTVSSAIVEVLQQIGVFIKYARNAYPIDILLLVFIIILYRIKDFYTTLLLLLYIIYLIYLI